MKVLHSQDYSDKDLLAELIPQKHFQLMAGKAHKLGCPKIILDHMRVYVHLGFLIIGINEQNTPYFYPTRLAGKAASRVGPKIVLDHMRIMFVRFGFPHHWLYTMLLTTHLRRGLTRTEK